MDFKCIVVQYCKNYNQILRLHSSFSNSELITARMNKNLTQKYILKLR